MGFVNSAKAGSATVTLPTGIQANDIIILFGYRNATTAPSLPAGFTAPTGGTISANANAGRLCYKIASGAESGTTATMTNANVIQCVVYRSFWAVGTVTMATNAASTTTGIPASTPQVTDGTSWAVYGCGSKQVASQSTPAGTTLRGATQAGTTSIALVADSNAGGATIPSKSSTAGSAVTGLGWSLELIATTPAANFHDDYNDNSIDPQWDSGTVGTGSTLLETNQQMEMAPAALTGSECYLDAGGFTPKWTLIGSYYFVNLKQAMNPGTDTFNNFHVICNDHYEIYFSIRENPRNLHAFQVVNDVETDLASVAYDPLIHQWLRIREVAGTTFFDLSRDGRGWTNFFSVANPIPLASVYIKLNAFADTEPAPGTLIWDSLNVPPPIGALAGARQAINRASTF